MKSVLYVNYYASPVSTRLLDGVFRFARLSVPKDIAVTEDVPLDFCAGEIPTADGFVKISWRREGASIKVEQSAPTGWKIGGVE